MANPQKDPLGILGDQSKEIKVQADPLGILKKKPTPQEVWADVSKVLPGSGIAGASSATSTGKNLQIDPSKALHLESNDPLGDAQQIISAKLFQLENPNEGTNSFDRFQQIQQARKEYKGIQNAFNNDGQLADKILSDQLAKKGAVMKPKQVIHGLDFLQGDPPEEKFQGGSLANYSLDEIQKSIDPKNQTQKIAFETLKKDRSVDHVLNNSHSIEDAAITFASSMNPQLNRQLQYLRSKGMDLPEAQKGEIVAQFVLDPVVLKKAEHDQNINLQVLGAQQLLYQHYPEFGKKVVSQKISQYREDEGKNNPVVNIPRKGATDDVVNEMVEKGKLTDEEKAIYEKEIRPDLGFMQSLKRGVGRLVPGVQANMEESPIATPGFLETAENSYNRTLQGMAHSVEDLINTVGTGGGTNDNGKVFTPEQRLYDMLAKNHSMVTVNPKGLNQLGQAGGDIVGFVAPMVLGGVATKAAGMGSLSGELLTNTLMFEGQNKDHAIEMFPGDNEKQLMYTSISTPIDVLLAKTIPNKEAMAEIKGELNPEIKKIINDFTNDKITGEAAKEQLLNKITAIAKDNAKMGGVMAGFDIIHNGLDAAFGGRDVSMDDAIHSAVQSFKHGFLGNTFLAGVHHMGAEPELGGKVLREMAENLQTTKDLIEQDAAKSPELDATKEEKLKNLQTVTDTWKEIKDLDAKQPEKEKFLLKDLQQKIFEEKAKNAKVDIVKNKYDKKVAQLKIEKNKLIDPEMGNKKFVEEMYDEDLLPKGSKLLLEDEKGKFSEHKVGAYLKFIAQQANGLDENWKPTGDKVNIEGIPESVIEAANDRWEKEVTEATTKPRIRLSAEEKQPKESKISEQLKAKAALDIMANNMKKPRDYETIEEIHNRSETGKPISFKSFRVAGNDNFNEQTGMFLSDKDIVDMYATKRKGEINTYEINLKNPLKINSKEGFIKSLAEKGDEEAKKILPNWQESDLAKLQPSVYVSEIDKFIKRKAEELGHDGIINVGSLEIQVLDKSSINKVTSQSKTENNAEDIRSDQGQVGGTGNEPRPSTNEGSENLQLDEKAPSGNGETEQQAGNTSEEGKDQGQEGIDYDLPFGRQGTTGIAHNIQEGRVYDTKSRSPERGEGVSVEDAIKHGKDLMQEGNDPNKAAEDFKKDKKISFDALSLVRAKHEQLVKATNKATEDFGENSKEEKAAIEAENKWYNDVVKPMQTEWHKIGQAQQGEVDIDTGTYMGLRRAFGQENGKDFNPKQAKEAKELSGQVKKLTSEVDKLKAKLTTLLDKGGEKGKDKTIKEKSKDIADLIRKGKTSRPDSFSAATPASLVWDGALEVIAKTIELGGEVTQAIADGLAHIKASEWYKNLNKEDQEKSEKDFNKYFEPEPTPEEKNIKRLEKELEDLKTGRIKSNKDKRELSDREKELMKQISEEKKALGLNEKVKPISPSLPNKPESEQFYDLATHFADKNDNKFSPEEAKAIWDYAKKTYLDKNGDFDNMISKTATDLGLTTSQVRHAIASPKGAKEVTDEMYRKQYQRTMAVNRAKMWVKTANTPKAIKFLKAIPGFFFGLKTFGHGTVGGITHAGMNIFVPSGWKTYWPNFFKQFQFAYGDTARYEKAMQDLVRDKDFPFWKHAGLAVDPTEKYDDYQMFTKYFGKLGKAGDRGFNALKIMRFEQAKALYNQTSNVERADPNTEKEIAKIVNHATGSSKIPLPEAANVAFFAPRLEVSRWNRLIVEPIKAIKTVYDWKNATPAERVAAKIVMKRAGQMMATYFGALAVNQGILVATGSNQRINFFNPQDSDWLKFKAGGKTLDVTGGMISTMKLIAGLFHAATESPKELKGKSRTDVISNKVWNYTTGKFSPFAGTVKDVATHRDFSGNVMPFSNDKPASGKKKLSWKEYLLEQQTPIPIAEALHTVNEEMKERGIKQADIDAIMNGILSGVVSGGTGAKLAEQPKAKEEDTHKHRRPTH